jgi:hypothetical protein
MILGDKPLISEVVLSHNAALCDWAGASQDKLHIVHP